MNATHAPARLEPRPAPTPGRLDVVRAVYAAYERRDLAAAAALFHPDGEIHQTEALPWGGLHRGHDGLRAFMERLTLAITTRIEDEELFEAGAQVVSVGRTRGWANGTGRRFDLPAVHVYTIADGLIHRYEAYVDTPAMLRALAA